MLNDMFNGVERNLIVIKHLAQHCPTIFYFFFVLRCKNDVGWIHLLDARIAKNATTCLFASQLGYAYGVGNKSAAR